MGFVRGICTVLILAPLFSFISLWNLVGVAVVALVIWAWSQRRSCRRWRLHVDGYVEPGFERVAEVFRKSIHTKEESGAAFSVYFKGRLVVDLWGGYADFGALRLRQQESTSMFYSATKAVTAIVMAILVDRGWLDYDAPVGKYWPEFAENGKGDITVKTLLSHRAGLIAIREKHKLSLIRDNPQKLSDLLAKQKPFWRPGTAQGYHMLTYGLYADQLVRRVDPKARTLGDFFQQEIAQPFDIDFCIGEPKTEHYRACRETRATFSWKQFFTIVIPTGIKFVLGALYAMLVCRTIHLFLFVGNPTDWKPRRLNDPKYRELQCGSSHGFGTARGMAKLMGILANGGQHLGQTLLSQKWINILNSPLSSEFDRVVLRRITYGPGTTIMTAGKDQGQQEHNIFGHWGAGGQMAFADPTLNMGWAYTTNYCNILHGFVIDHRYKALQKVMYECAYEICKQK